MKKRDYFDDGRREGSQVAGGSKGSICAMMLTKSAVDPSSPFLGLGIHVDKVLIAAYKFEREEAAVK
jgi:hypothetical protein